MDVQMPVMDGLEATRQMRSNSRLAGLPVVAMTAHAMNGDRERCLDAGMNEYLAKPVDHKLLLTVVERYLAKALQPGQPAPAPECPPAASQIPAISGPDPALVDQMRQLFAQLAPERMKRMRQAASDGDLSVLKEDARKVHGAAQSLSASAVVRCAECLERAADAEDHQAVALSLQNLEEELRRIQDSVTARIPG
jgi:two-component system sensor histidine kinase/response regulator